MTIEMSDADYAHYLLGEDIDLDAQLLAIRDLLRRHGAASEDLSAEIQAVADAAQKASGPYAEHLVDISVDRMHASVYQDAAHSMAAAGMLAPLMESILARVFAGIGRQPWPLVDQARLQRSGEGNAAFWDARVYFDAEGVGKSDIIVGVRQLAAASGLSSYLPDDFETACEALVLYRNRMFHNGFEWPPVTRERFAKLIEEKGWEAWFASSSTNHEPWIFYLTRAFIERCLLLIDQTLDAVGQLVRDRTSVHGFDLAT